MNGNGKLAIITARSGSKSLPNKNIKEFAGIPLIAHTINCALHSNMFSEIFVSTDSEHYAEIARNYDASVPFLRSRAISLDSSSPWDAVKEALDKYENSGKIFDSITLLQPTSPLRTPDDIIEAHKIFNNNNANAVVSVCEAEHSPLWCNTLPSNDSLSNFIGEELLGKPRQTLPTYYRINGAIYIVQSEYLKNDGNLYKDNCFAYIMPRERSIDIDQELDFNIAEMIYCKTRNNEW